MMLVAAALRSRPPFHCLFLVLPFGSTAVVGGCGRSGTAVLRLMVEAGEEASVALGRLRAVRPCAVETPEQFAWAAGGKGEGAL